MAGKILVVDDEPTALRLAEYVLKREGYQVVSAANGLDALEKVRKECPDLVVLDVMMPGMNGYDVCRRLRLSPETSHLSVLMLTAQARDEDRDAAMASGASDYLSKPVDPSAFVAKVRSLLARDI